MSLRSRARRDKGFAERLHAKRRAAQRYDFWATDSDLDAIVSQIERGDCTLVFRESNRVSVYDVVYSERTFRVAHDAIRHQLITFLPMTCEAVSYAV